MNTEDQGWTIDDGPDTTSCDLGQHDWNVDHACDRCDDVYCFAVCRDCGAETRDCEDA